MRRIFEGLILNELFQWERWGEGPSYSEATQSRASRQVALSIAHAVRVKVNLYFYVDNTTLGCNVRLPASK